MTAPRPPGGADAIQGTQIPTRVESSARPVTSAPGFPAGRAPEALFHGLTPAVVVALQRTAGNAAVTAMLARQPITPPKDPRKTILFLKYAQVWVNNTWVQHDIPHFDPAIPDHKYDWQVPPDARTVKVRIWIAGDGIHPSTIHQPNPVVKLTCDFDIATDGTLSIHGETSRSHDQQWPGATLDGVAGLRNSTPNAATMVVEQRFDTTASGGSTHVQTIEFTLRSPRRREKITRMSLTGFALDSAQLTPSQLAQLRRFMTRGTPSAVDKLKSGKAKARITGFADATGTPEWNERVAASRLFSLELEMARELDVPVSAFEAPRVDGSQSAEDERSQHPEKPKANPKWRKVDIEIVDQ
jgi:outer membrane protein OmpA-like peptidoglycan-associated protein